MKSLFLVLALNFFASGGTVVTFDNDAIGKAPPGWTVAMTNHGAAPKWEVLKDQTAATQPYVLAQVAADPVGNRFPLAILNWPSMGDGDVSVRVKPVSGTQEQAGGLVFRFRDANNYYLARANARQQNIALIRIENGERRQIAVVKHDVPPNDWRILKVSVRGNRIQVYVDRRRVLQSYDGAFTEQGKVGLWTVGDSITYFDDFRVNPK